MSAYDSVSLAQQSALAQQISVAVAKKQLDGVRQQGDAVNQLLAAAAQIGKAIGKGASIDATA